MPDKYIKRVVVLGPESTGKSTLCALLAKHYDTLWCPEYARAYMEQHGNRYKYEDLLEIAKGQMALEQKYLLAVAEMEKAKCKMKNEKNKSPVNNSPLPLRRSPLLFVDTDMHVMKVWCEYVFGKCHQFILEQVAKQNADLYLLCNIDLPWTFDELREYPDVKPREELFAVYKDILVNQKAPWTIVSGACDQRVATAIEAVEHTLLR